MNHASPEQRFGAGAQPAVTAPEDVLWDVLEEHHDEAAYCLQQFQRTLQSPVLGLEELARNPEPRLLAHVDGLVVAGRNVVERLLRPALEAADPADPWPALVAAWALIELGDFAALAPLLGHEQTSLRQGLAEVARLATHPSLDGWIMAALSTSAANAPIAGLLALCASRNLAPPGLMRWLQSDDVSVVEPAAQAARFGEGALYSPVLHHLLEHESGVVRDAALLANLAWGSQHAWLYCERWALDSVQPSALATELYASLGTRFDHARLLELLSVPAARRGVLSVLGLTGNIELDGTLLPLLTAKDPLEPKLAAQALGMIFGFLPADPAYAAVPAAETGSAGPDTLPALEDDDLEADLVPAPEEQLPAPNADAIRECCEERKKTLAASKRVLFGGESSPRQARHLLRYGPLNWHHAQARALGVRSGGVLWLDTRCLTRVRANKSPDVEATAWKRQLSF